MTIARSLARLCALICCVAVPAHGQVGGPAAADIEIAVAKYLRDSVAGGADVKFDSRLFSDGHPDAERPRARVVALEQVLHGRAAHEADVEACGGTPRTCSINASSFYHLSEPVVNGRSATVRVRHLIRQASARRPTERIDFDVMLERVGSTWRVASIQVLSMT